MDAKAASKSVWGASPAGTTHAAGNAPGTREFFEAVLERRSTHEQPWLPEVIPFASFAGRRVLEVGCGAGYDAYAAMSSGAEYTGIDLTPENPERVRRHLGYYGLEPTVLQGDAEDLPFGDGSFDVVFSNGVLMSTPDMPRAFREARRVLKPGGEFYAVIYNRNSIFYLLNIVLAQQILMGGWRKHSLSERRSMIEYTTSEELPLVNVYSPRQLRKLALECGFTSAATKVRKLTPEDFPSLPYAYSAWRLIPQRWLDLIGKAAGWYVCLNASR